MSRNSLCVIVNGTNLYSNIISRALDYVDIDAVVTDKIPEEHYDNIIIFGEPNSIQENLIIGYTIKYHPSLYYLGSVNSIKNYCKYNKYINIMLYDVDEDNYSIIRDMQLVVGTERCNIVPNPAYSLEFGPRSKHLADVYGLIKNDIVTDEDYTELYNLSARVSVRLGLLKNDNIEKIQAYVYDNGLPVDIRIIHNIDEYFKYFSVVDRIQQPSEYKGLSLSANIINNDMDAQQWKEYRIGSLSKYHMLDLGKIALIVNNGRINHNTSYYNALNLNTEQLGTMYESLKPIDECMSKQIINYEKYGCMESYDIDHISYAKNKSKLSYEHDGGVKVIKNMYNYFIRDYKAHMFYAHLPVDYPWIGVLDSNETKLHIDGLFDSVWFQRSLLSCYGFVTSSEYAKKYMYEKYNKINIKSLCSSFTISTMFPSIRYQKHIKLGNKITYVYEQCTNPFSIFKFFDHTELYQKYYYGFSLPPSVNMDNNIIDDSWSTGCRKYVLDIYSGIMSFTFNIEDPLQSYTNDKENIFSRNNLIHNEKVKSAYWDINRCINSCRSTDTWDDSDVYITEIDPNALTSPILAYCTYHSIPLIINKCCLSIEYLGEDYPLFNGYISEESIANTITYLSKRKIHLPMTITETDIYQKI